MVAGPHCAWTGPAGPTGVGGVDTSMSRPRSVGPAAAPGPGPAAGPPQDPAGRTLPHPVPRPRASPVARPAPSPRQPATDQPDVWELVRRVQAGDAESFGGLYDRYVDVVHRFLSTRVGDRATAEDFTSETFVRALRRIDSLSFQGRDVGAWLITIARNIVLDHVKSSRYRLEVPTADMRDADRATDGPEESVLQRLTNADLLTGMAQLSVDQRECLALRFLQGLSVAETAAAMGRKDGAVKALQHRAVRRLATLLPEGLG